MSTSSIRNLTANYNQIDLFKIGIGVYPKVRAVVSINENLLNAPGGVYIPTNMSYFGISGIEVHNGVSVNSSVNISRNSITNVKKGVSVMNLPGVSGVGSSVNENFIYFPIDYSTLQSNNLTLHGIRLLNCNNVGIRFNNISRPQSTETRNGLEWQKMYGILGSFLHNGDLCQNTIENYSSGVNLRDDSQFTILRYNDFNGCFRGADIGITQSISGVITGIAANISNQAPFLGNEWNVTLGEPAYTNRVFGKTAIAIRWWNLTGTTIGDSEFAEVSNTFNISNPQTTLFAQFCPSQVTAEDYDRELLIGSIVADTVRYDDFSNERRYYAICGAFKELHADTNRLHIDKDTDTTYIDFYNNYKNSNIAKFIYVDQLINDEQLEIALDSLDAIIDTNMYESNRKAVLELYLLKYLYDEAFSVDDSLILEDIAYECALLGGPAVYEARAMLNVDVFDTCLTGGSRMGNSISENFASPTKQYNFKVHPNPSSGQITFVNKNNNIYGKIDIFIREMSGRIVIKKQVSGDFRSTDFILNELSQGLYTYEIYIDGSLVQTDKLIINP